MSLPSFSASAAMDRFSSVVVALGVAFLLWTTFLLVASRKQRNARLSLCRARGHSTADSKTPPRSLSPSGGKSAAAAEKTALTFAEYAKVFPPSRRSALVEVYDALPNGHPLKNVPRSSIGEPGQSIESRTPVPLAVPEHELQGHECTPTGISINELRLLGAMPDYATLSGVPLPEPYPAFDINRALARPYRPFRWAYHQTMSLTKMEPEWWVELTRDYKETIRLRMDLFERHGPLVLQHLPGSEIASRELMEMLLQFLCARYPTCFALDPPNGAARANGSSSTFWVFENKILNNTTILDGSEHPLITILKNVPEDYAIMLRDPATGLYHFRAGVICSSLGWTLGTKIGLKLNEIHEPVPDYAEKMRFSMDRYFAKKPTDRAIQRGSWGLEVETPLFMPPGDAHEKYRDYQMDPAELPLSRVHLRVDWQTLRRLPISGAVVFNFKGLFTPIEEFRDEPHIPKLVLKVLNEGKENIMKYKNCWHVEHVVKPALEAWSREQEDNGLVERDWEVRTLDDAPYFPGWEDKWRQQMKS